MNEEMHVYWDFIKRRDFEYITRFEDVNSDCVVDLYELTENILAACKKDRDDPIKTCEIFRDLDDYHYPYEDEDEPKDLVQDKIRADLPMRWYGPLILRWIYGLTRINGTYLYANQTVEQILNNHCKNSDWKVKEEKEYKLYKLLKEEKEQHNIKIPLNISPQTTINNFTITPNILPDNRKDKNRKIEDKSDLPKKEEHEDEVKKFIEDKVREIDNNGWHYVFRSEADYYKFLGLFTAFFTGVLYPLQTVIDLKKGCKTRFSPILGMIHKEFSHVILKNDKEYFQILKILNVFKELMDNQIYKAITRESERI